MLVPKSLFELLVKPDVLRTLLPALTQKNPAQDQKRRPMKVLSVLLSVVLASIRMTNRRKLALLVVFSKST
jgi:hypothetical protein